MEVYRDEIADNQTNQIMLCVREMAQRAAKYKDALLAILLANGDQAGYLAYDSKVYFATDHESGDSGVQSNNLAPVALTIAEFQTALRSGLEALLKLKDDHAEPSKIS